jgi:septal ring factor EnvC (AmiA/AmiB activator)
LNGTVLDGNVVGNWTVQDMIADAETALAVLASQPEVDVTALTILGWVPRLMVHIGNLSDALTLTLSELEAATGKISALEEDLANQTQAFNQALDAAHHDLATTNQEISDLGTQLTAVQAEAATLQNTVAGMEAQNRGLQAAVDLSRNLTYLSLGVAAIAIALAIRTSRKH